MSKNAIFGSFFCHKFLAPKNFNFFHLILIKGSISVSLIPISAYVYPGQQNIDFFVMVQITERSSLTSFPAVEIELAHFAREK